MNKILNDRTSAKARKSQSGPWSPAAPTKDQAHSGYLSCGDAYGTGVSQPVGKFKASGMDSGPIPQSSKCFSPNEIFNGEDKRG